MVAAIAGQGHDIRTVAGRLGRHWSAAVAISQGHDVRIVAGRLGHANPAMTLRVYAHAVAAADHGGASSLGEALRGPSR